LKLLVDFNLSPKLIPALADLFPESAHLQTLGFVGTTADEVIWKYARDQDLTLLTSDRDFIEIADRLGHPPKVIRLARMNYRTKFAVELLRTNAIRIAEFVLGPQSVLVLYYK
jgi:predicted nuclease of predicted toxin-antitoxin system